VRDDEEATMRVVVTGDRDGKSVIARDQQVDPAVMPDLTMGLMWGTDQSPIDVPADADSPSPAADGFFPPAGGVRATLVEFAPSDSLDTTAGLHQADTVDLVWVIDGELGCNLDSGETAWLDEGDLMVVHGARHQWFNRTQETARAGFISLGAERSG
jgi:hypothetical protein